MAGDPASALSGDMGCATFEQQVHGHRGFRYKITMPEFGKVCNRSTMDFPIFCLERVGFT